MEKDGTVAAVSDSILEPPARKRKRKRAEEELEDAYMRKMAEAEAREAKSRRPNESIIYAGVDQDDERSSSPGHDQGASIGSSKSDVSMDEDKEAGASPPPQHETLGEERDEEMVDVEKASRTVFLANVSTEAITSKSARKAVLHHLASFFPELSPYQRRRSAQGRKYSVSVDGLFDPIYSQESSVHAKRIDARDHQRDECIRRLLDRHGCERGRQASQRHSRAGPSSEGRQRRASSPGGPPKMRLRGQPWFRRRGDETTGRRRRRKARQEEKVKVGRRRRAVAAVLQSRHCRERACHPRCRDARRKGICVCSIYGQCAWCAEL